MRSNLAFLVVAGALAAIATTSAAGAQPLEPLVATASSLGQKALNDPAAFDFVQSLATEIGQRLAGTEAHKRAVAWAEARLKAAGFENVHSEPFTLRAWIRGAENADIVGPVPQHLAITTLGGSVATDPNGIEAEIAVFHTYDELLAAAPGSLTGKIAVVTQHMMRMQDGSGYGAANRIRRSGPSEAAKRGAVAYLLRSLGTDNRRLPHTGALDYQDGAPQIPAAALSVPDAEQLDRLAALGPVRIRLLLMPSFQDNAPSWNVVGEIKGSQRPDEIVLIGGHLDSWDLGTGATDDGAGDAIAFGAARLVAGLPRAPEPHDPCGAIRRRGDGFQRRRLCQGARRRSRQDRGRRRGGFRRAKCAVGTDPAGRRRQRFWPCAATRDHAARRDL